MGKKTSGNLQVLRQCWGALQHGAGEHTCQTHAQAAQSVQLHDTTMHTGKLHATLMCKRKSGCCGCARTHTCFLTPSGSHAGGTPTGPSQETLMAATATPLKGPVQPHWECLLQRAFTRPFARLPTFRSCIEEPNHAHFPVQGVCNWPPTLPTPSCFQRAKGMLHNAG